MGESDFERKSLAVSVEGAVAELLTRPPAEMRVQTPGGRFQVRWDEHGGATAMGQLAFFAEFLDVSGLFDRWVAACPMTYTSPNAPTVRDVLGTWLLSILDGHRRYSHVSGLRGDVVAPQILGMKRIISDEGLRRALAHLAPTLMKCPESEREGREAKLAASAAWMDVALAESTREALCAKWILDCDTTVKLLYGHQTGAEVGYNPKKPGRPSHAIHTYWMAQLRLVLDAEVQGGKAHGVSHGLPRLLSLLNGLSEEKRPYLVRGDNAFGVEPVMGALEAMGQGYLFKLRQTTGVKRLIERMWQRQGWMEVGYGTEAAEAALCLLGWKRARRVVVLRRPLKASVVVEHQGVDRQGRRQQTLAFADGMNPSKLWEYVVLVNNTDIDLVAIGQLYRDRADCENGFDELKNQWGWGGYTTQDRERCNLSARAVALIYNWWSWYVRLAHPKTRLEAVTSRPLLLSGVARLTQHAGQSRLLITLVHEADHWIKEMIANVRAGLDIVVATAPQLTKPERWRALVRYIIGKIIAARSRISLAPAIEASQAPPLIAVY